MLYFNENQNILYVFYYYFYHNYSLFIYKLQLVNIQLIIFGVLLSIILSFISDC